MKKSFITARPGQKLTFSLCFYESAELMHAVIHQASTVIHRTTEAQKISCWSGLAILGLHCYQGQSADDKSCEP